jgi:hypothetical protein
MGVAAMAIHAPAHRPAYHFHFAVPHVDGSETGVLMLVVGVVAMLAITWGAMAGATPSAASPSSQAYSAAMSAAAYDGSSTIEALQVRQAGPLGPEAQSLLTFRAGERGSLVGEAESLVLFRAGERESR